MDTAALDNLATNGIINFDADAYIRGTAPRYVGHPHSGNGLPFEQPLGYAPLYPGFNAQLPHQPAHDEFKHEEHKKFGIKGLLTTGIIAALIIGVGVKFKNGIKKLFSKKTPKPPVVKPATTGKTKRIGDAFNWFKKSKPAKITAGIGLGLLALYGLYDVIIKRKLRNEAEAEAETPHPAPTQAKHK